MINASLVRVSQYPDVDRFEIVVRYVVPDADAAAVRLRSGQQLMNVIALASGEPTTTMVTALSEEIARIDRATGGFDDLAGDYPTIARRLLKAALAPTACTWSRRPRAP